MKKVSILFLITACLLILYACSDSERKITEQKSEEEIAQSIIQDTEKAINYKINLLSLKYEITSDKLIQDIIEFLRNSELDRNIIFQIMQKSEKADELLAGIGSSKRDVISIDKLKSLSTQYNVPVNKLAALFFDYMVLKAIEDSEIST